MSSRKPQRVGPCPSPVEVTTKEGRKLSIRCKSRRCDECGKLWAGDQNRRLVANLDHYSGPLLMGSLTAPGKDALSSSVHIALWNEQAPVNWRLLNAECQKRTRRDTGRQAVLLAWVWEKQKRGALHKHFALGIATAHDRHAAMTYLGHMEALRSFYGFGFMDRGKWDAKKRRRSLRELSGLHAGRYMAKYLMKRDAAGNLAVQELVKDKDVPPLVVYVSRNLSGATGITMRALREHRHLVATSEPASPELIRHLLLASGYSVDQVDELMSGNAPPSPAAAVPA